MALGKCCFCIPLRAGALIIGYLNLIGAIAFAALTTFNVHTGSSYVLRSDNPRFIRMGCILAWVNVALLVFFTHLLVFAIVLLVGLHQQKRGHVKAYLMYSLIINVLYIIYVVLNVFLVWFNGGYFVFIQIIPDVISILLNIFFLVVIRNYYLQMDEPAKKPTIYYNTANVGHTAQVGHSV